MHTHHTHGPHREGCSSQGSRSYRARSWRPGAITFVLSLLSVVFLLWTGGPASAQAETDRDEQVVITGRVHVAPGERSGTVVVVDGPVTVDGEVDGAVVVLNGSVSVSGRVAEDVVVLNGAVTIRPGARISGDVVSRETATVAPDAVVEGEVRQVNVDVALSSLSLVGRLASWLAYTVSTLLLGLLLLLVAPRAFEAAAFAARSRTGPVIGWGVLLFFGLPVVAILAIVTLVGIPLGLALLLGLWLIYTIGYTTSLWVLGRILVRRPGARFSAFFAGWGILRALALVPVLAGFLWMAGAVFGLGALIVAAWRARAQASVPPAVPAPPPPVPATPYGR